MKQGIATLVTVLVLPACAITSGHEIGPNGRPVYFIDGMSAGVTFDRARQLCPKGYTILGTPRQTTLIDYVMTIECK